MNEFAFLLFVPLPLILLAVAFLRRRYLLALALILSAITASWFGPRFRPQETIPADPSPFTVVTFNVWGYNAQLNEVEAWFLAQDADLILLQEIPERYANQQILELVEQYPYQVSQSTDVRWWGNLFLSRYPILSAETLPGDNVPAQQRFTIDYDGRTLAVYNVHFAMPTGPSRLPQFGNRFALQTALSYDNRTRNGEIERLLERLADEPYPYIVAGDFNMGEDAAIYGAIAETMGDAYREAGTGWGGTWPVPIVTELPYWLPPVLRVDYIWHSQHFHPLEAGNGPKLGSDHLPVYARFNLYQPLD
jgi:endonuclease/exonuclease/phosphatase (EEP) superfamily protein YafD